MYIKYAGFQRVIIIETMTRQQMLQHRELIFNTPDYKNIGLIKYKKSTILHVEKVLNTKEP